MPEAEVASGVLFVDESRHACLPPSSYRFSWAGRDALRLPDLTIDFLELGRPIKHDRPFWCWRPGNLTFTPFGSMAQQGYSSYLVGPFPRKLNSTTLSYEVPDRPLERN